MTKKIFIITLFVVSIPQMALSGDKLDKNFYQMIGNSDHQNLIGKLEITYLKKIGNIT